KFDLDGIPPSPRGMPQIEVTFDIDANGIIHVGAKDLGTNKAQHITISAENKLSKEEIKKFIKQAEEFAEEDKKYKEKVEVKNESDSLLYATEKSLKEHGDKVSQDERLAIDRAVGELKDALKVEDVEKMKTAKEELIKVSQKLGEAIYKEAQAKTQASQAAGAQAGASGGSQGGAEAASEEKKEDVVDAEVVDETKK
ncbi:MAG: Hsp70 family protein, partial [Elusimicrobia bacterium]|nr:Hsp70 family protein [Elusimicrobiota bacterium]